MQDTDISTGNEISLTGKIAAGLLLILFTLFPIWLIMAYWPDRIPGPKEPVKPLYLNKLYHVRLACIPDKAYEGDTIFLDTAHKAIAKSSTKESVAGRMGNDSAKIAADSILDDTTKTNDTTKSTIGTLQQNPQKYYLRDELIDLSTIILILVAAAGFLGNMIHIASSFTTFVGAKKFKRSWVLWYCVKPFTASALALGLYFVFRGGFLNYSAEPSSINIYGILTISVLAGLFTDRATLKLSEVFDVIFSIKKDLKNDDPRPDKLNAEVAKIISVEPDKLVMAQENVITIKGENLDKHKFSFKINDESVSKDKIQITATAIMIKYTVPASQADSIRFKLQVSDEKNTDLFTKVFTV
jgi:hypothetical protein